jgi:hypothetical protein
MGNMWPVPAMLWEGQSLAENWAPRAATFALPYPYFITLRYAFAT